jgi:DNA-binding LacI/PurR family transcriptional regulator
MLKTVNRKSNKSAGVQIKETLLSRIAEQEAGSKLPTEQEMCDQFGVSRMTVNKVITGLVRDGYVYRIRSKGTFVKKPFETCRSMKFLLPGPGSLTSSKHRVVQLYLAGAVREAHRLGMRMETVVTTPDHKLDSLKPEMFESLSPDDNVFVLAQWWYPVFPALAKSGCNVVYVNGQITNPEFNDYFHKWFLLTVDTTGAVEDIVDYLVASGREKIFTFRIQDRFFCFDPRTRGFLNGMEKNGLIVDMNLMPEAFYNSYMEEGYLSSLIKESYKKKAFDSIICPPDFISQVFKALADLGLKVPDDVAVVATNDSEIIENAPVPVSAMAIPYGTLGAEAVKCFNRDVFEPGEKVFRPVLVERESSCKGAGNRENPYLKDRPVVSDKNDFFHI